MIDLHKVKGILFDYGGTIDSNGLHWAEVIWEAYTACSVPVSRQAFREAYVHGERTLGKNPLVQPCHTFADMLRIKCRLQIDWLKEASLLSADTSDELPDRLADYCYAYAGRCIDAARPVLEELAGRYPLVLVSNFYGNIETVLKDFRLEHFFAAVIESAVVGIRKPDPAIFALGVKALGLKPEAVIVIGDSYDKDIVPSRQTGCQTVWLKNTGWLPCKGDETADAVITDFLELRNIFN
ncbi:dUMP phosphatase [Bacteroidales bacterium Barb7]|nr:dUMP phosphatase [Bacteroidales bacterium Barb7]